MKEIIDAYESGESIVSLKKRYHMGYYRLKQILGKDRMRSQAGAIRVFHKLNPHLHSPSPEIVELIKELYQAEYSCTEIEDKTGVNKGVVFKIIKAAGLSRSVEEAKAIARRKGRLRDWGYSPKRNELVSVLLDECA